MTSRTNRSSSYILKAFPLGNHPMIMSLLSMQLIVLWFSSPLFCLFRFVRSDSLLSSIKWSFIGKDRRSNALGSRASFPGLRLALDRALRFFDGDVAASDAGVAGVELLPYLGLERVGIVLVLSLLRSDSLVSTLLLPSLESEDIWCDVAVFRENATADGVMLSVFELVCRLLGCD